MFVSEIIDDVKEILGRCSIDLVFKRITDAIKALQDEGDWNANIGVVDICACSDGKTVTLPPEVETPLAVAVDGRPVFMRDQFAKFHLNGTGLNHPGVPWAWDDVGKVPVYMDIVTAGPLIAIVALSSDLGQTIRVMGLDETKRMLRTQLEDGTWIEGINVPTNLPSDFPNGIIQPSTSRQFQRIFDITPMVNFVSVDDHELATGAYMQLTLKTGAMPVPIEQGSFYYIRVLDSRRVTLHTSRLDSRTGQSPVIVTETEAGSVITFLDQRAVTTRTMFQTVDPDNLTNFDLVTFVATTMPEPLDSTMVYVVRAISNNQFSIFPTLEDATNQTNIINVTTPGSDIVVRRLKPMSPFTTLNFNVRHNMITGDAVTVENVGGALPEPLLAGQTYYVRVLTNFAMTLHSTLADAQVGKDPVPITTTGSGASSVVKVMAASATTGNSSNITTALAHNLNQPTGLGALATSTVNDTAVTAITVTNGGSGYEAPPKVIISGGGGTGATAQAVITGGVVTAINVITGGTDYDDNHPPTVIIQPASGSFVRFSTNGTLPGGITQGTVYRAEPPQSTTTFTLNTTLPEPINITSGGTGQLFLIISRTFTLGFLPQWRVDATNFTTGQAVRFFTQGVLPTTSPTIDQNTLYYLRRIDSGSVEVFDTKPHAENLASTTGRLSTISLGAGQLYFSSEIAATAEIRESLLDVEFAGYIQNLANVQFTTDGTLPAPLAPATTYQVSLVDGALQILTTGNVPIVLTTVGSGVHQMVISRDFSVEPSTSLLVPKQQFALGDQVTASTTETLPEPIAADTPYYARPVSPDTIELYDTSAHAVNLASVVGRLTYLTTGTGIQRLLQELPAYQVSRVDQVQKPVTEGYVTLYAWDEGRTDLLTLLGDYAPKVTAPAYRRIQVGKSCSWVRMKYRRSNFVITSERDFINLDQAMAIVMMVRCQDLLRKSFLDEAERFRKVAVDYLNKRDRALDGPHAPTLQIDADVITVPDDWMD